MLLATNKSKNKKGIEQHFNPLNKNKFIQIYIFEKWRKGQYKKRYSSITVC